MSSFWNFFAKNPHFSCVMWKFGEIVKNVKFPIFHPISSWIFQQIFLFRNIVYVKMKNWSFYVFWQIFKLSTFFVAKTPMFEKVEKTAKIGVFQGAFSSLLKKFLEKKISQKMRIHTKNHFTKSQTKISNRIFGGSKKPENSTDCRDLK